MTYRTIFSKKALKTLKKMDPDVSGLIIGWFEKNIEGTDDPRQHGKALIGDHKGEWRYRIGDYRAICEIVDNEVIIYVLEISHRSAIYRKK